jgi:Family of unknown function (DUF5719)
LVGLGVGLAVGGTAFVGPPDSVVRSHPEQVEPVVRSTSVCPYVGGEPRAASRLGVLAIEGVEEPAWLEPTAAAGEDEEPVVIRQLAGPDEQPEPLVTLDERGVPSTSAVERNDPAGFSVRARGRMAPGVVAEQYMLAEGPDLRGLVTSACTAPGREHWFVGASSGPGQRGRLVLNNASTTAAVVTVSLWDESGPVETDGTKDISIPPRSQEVLLLDALVSEAEQVGVRVRASQGRVAAAIDYRESSDGEPLGLSMIPAATTPSTSVVVPGIPGEGERTLHVIAPGDTDAIATVRVLGADGPFRPLDHDVITVPAGSIASVPIGDAVGDTPAAILLESDEEITAAVRVVSTGSGDDEDEAPEGGDAPDLAFTAATPALPDSPTASVLSRDSSDLGSRLLLTAVGDMGGRVTIITLSGEGDVLDDRVIDVPAGSTVVADLESGEDTAWAFTIVQAAVPDTVVAVREISGSDEGGGLIDLMPVVTPEVYVRVPEVTGELPTGLRPPGRTDHQQ